MAAADQPSQAGRARVRIAHRRDGREKRPQRHHREHERDLSEARERIGDGRCQTALLDEDRRQDAPELHGDRQDPGAQRGDHDPAVGCIGTRSRPHR